MLYRQMPSSGESLPVLGMGCMRLPETPEGRVDDAAAIALIRAAVDGGATYIDTARPYHNGESERIVGRALADGYRERAFLATKLPSWKVESREEMDRCLDEQLRRLGTDHLDAYLVHALTRRRWNKLWDLEVDTFLDEAKADGRIRYAGFSFHDDLPTFTRIVDEYAWDLCQVQYNYLDEHYQAGTEGVRYAAEKGLAVVVMEPLRGGLLAGKTPEDVEKIFAAAPVRRSPAEWGLGWVWDHPEVTTVLSGMGTPEALDENLAAAEAARPGALSPEEHKVIDAVREVYRARLAVPCTGCRYCMPCPCGVNIPECLAQVNNASLYDDPAYAAFFYRSLLGEGGSASWCTECGMCLSLCPQGIEIPEVLKEAVSLFEK
ncbi:aldo/keto reductase [Methanofollis aquaemaris]|uniref:Aldo/keto reductase n=1 Tax=Methanofollis aquaemaris TaxID=126734 RepID=A0A8A3S5M4_9EURY|nr:aldo/keto reductase [Methanofollis aquaemaris]QSZ67031.1 aldo/keto reductase [Methanofollis aquaemaris]